MDAGSMSMGGEEWQVRIDAGAESHLFGHSFGHQTRRMGDEDVDLAPAYAELVLTRSAAPMPIPSTDVANEEHKVDEEDDGRRPPEA